MRNRLIALSALAALLAMLGVWRTLAHKPTVVPPPSASAASPMPATAVRTATAWRERVDDLISAVGTLAASESVILRPEIAGRIDSIGFAEGTPVRKGDVLFVLNGDEIRAALTQAEAQQLLDRQNFERVKEMRRKNLTSAQQFDELLARLKVSDASVERERVRLAKMLIRAPFDGIVGLRLVSVGDYVSAGQDLANIESIDTVKLDFKVPEKYAGLIAPGLAVKVAVDAYPERNFPGKIFAIDPRLDEATRALRIRARLPNERLLLRPGMFARLSLGLSGTREALFVPEQAIVQKSSTAYVFRVTGTVVRLVEVTTGTRRMGQVEIASGLAPGDRVVTDGQTKLRDGMEVEVVDSGTRQ